MTGSVQPSCACVSSPSRMQYRCDTGHARMRASSGRAACKSVHHDHVSGGTGCKHMSSILPRAAQQAQQRDAGPAGRAMQHAGSVGMALRGECMHNLSCCMLLRDSLRVEHMQLRCELSVW